MAALDRVGDDTYALILGCLLAGKAADIYMSLPPEITNSYPLLKKALLTWFNKTPGRYRAEFLAR